MRIKQIVSQHRRDFKAIFECEHCNVNYTQTGYDDHNYHNNVIPSMSCNNCGETSPDTYVPITPKYPAGVVV